MGIPYAEVIGDPIAHSKSPTIHKFWLEKLGLAGDYRATKVTAAQLPAYFAARRADPDWRGCNVTIPHKESVVPLIDSVSSEGSALGAANLIIGTPRGLLGENSDLAALRTELRDVADTSALLELAVIVVGAGGAARAVLQAVRDLPDLRVMILNRDVARAEALLRQFGLRGEALPLDARLVPAGLVVNASSLGMTSFPDLCLDLADVGKPLVVDLVYAPVETGLLRQAREAGMPTIDGLSILMEQARIAFERFFRLPAPLGCEEELRELLTR